MYDIRMIIYDILMSLKSLINTYYRGRKAMSDHRKNAIKEMIMAGHNTETISNNMHTSASTIAALRKACPGAPAPNIGGRPPILSETDLEAMKIACLKGELRTRKSCIEWVA